MKKVCLFLMLLATTAVGGEPSPMPVVKHKLAWLTDHQVIREMLERTNAERARAGLYPLKLNAELCLDSQRHAERLVREGSFYHGYNVAEVMHQQQRSAADAINGLMNSPPHRALMLSSNYSVCGCGYSADAYGNTRWIIRFQ